MTETDWTRRICGELARLNALVFACVAQKMQSPGWPDRWVSHTLWTGWLEFKGRHTPLGALQAVKLREINARRPGTAYVARWPGVIEDHAGNELARFRGARELLEVLHALGDDAGRRAAVQDDDRAPARDAEGRA